MIWGGEHSDAGQPGIAGHVEGAPHPGSEAQGRLPRGSDMQTESGGGTEAGQVNGRGQQCSG